MTAVKRKWRRELAHASRGLEEPRPRGPAAPPGDTRRGVTKAPLALPPSCAAGYEGRAEIRRFTHRLGRRLPRAPGGVRPREARGRQQGRELLRGTGALLAAATAHHGSPGRPVPAARAAHRKRTARVIACDPRASATGGSSVGTDWRLRG